MITVKDGWILIDGNRTFFRINEFIPDEILNMKHLDPLWFIDIDMIKLAIFTRNWFDAALIINTPNLQNRGYRTPHSTVGAKLSQHKFGKAFDSNVVGLSAAKMHQEIIDNQKAFMNMGLTTLEDISFTKTWVHQDKRYTGKDEILIVKP